MGGTTSDLMTILNRIKDPQTEDDWQLGKNIPDYARRLTIVKLKNLLSYLLNRPIWSEQSPDSDRTEVRIEWPIRAQIVPIFLKVLPLAYKKLGWDTNPPSDSVSTGEVCLILTLGFKELFETQRLSAFNKPWPKGLDGESWLEKVKLTQGQCDAILELIDHWERRLQRWVPTLLFHGSCATLDNVPGTSDLDTLMVISKETLTNANELENFIKEYHENQIYLFKFNPYMHHGHMVVTELELGELREASLPLCLAENGVTFGERPNLVLESDSDLETLFCVNVFEHFFRRVVTRASDVATAFDLLWWMSSSVIIPVLFLQIKDGYSRWKPEALDTVRAFLLPDEIELVANLTRIRLSAGEFFPPLLESKHPLLENSANLAHIIKSQKDATKLNAEILADLGINDNLIFLSHSMYQRLAGEAVRIFSERHFEDGTLKTCISVLSGKTISEPPALIDRSKYEATKNWITDFSKKSHDIASVYQYGEVGCPGLSDLDILVVLRDDATDTKPFSISDLPLPYQEVMGHDATFVGEKSLPGFLKIFPIFEAILLCGDGTHKVAATLSTLETVLPLYTIVLLSKYPSDLSYLCRLPEVRFKTILAFLHSFKHFVPMYQCLDLEIPQTVIGAIDKDIVIRSSFSRGEMPSVLELPEIMELMLRATAAVTKSLNDAWGAFAPDAPAMTFPRQMPVLGIQFVDNWAEEMFITGACERIHGSSDIMIPMPASLGWFVNWLSGHEGIASSTIAQSLNPQGNITQNNTLAEDAYSSHFNTLASFRQDLNSFAETETASGRSVSKYISLVDIPSCETTMFATNAGRFNNVQEQMNAKFCLPPNVKKILIPRFDTLGDIVLLQGFLDALVGQFPEAEITMLVRSGYDQLAPLFPTQLTWSTININPYRDFEEYDFERLETFLGLIFQGTWDLVFFTTYSRTWLDEILAAKLSQSARIALGRCQGAKPWLIDLLTRLNLETEVLYSRVVYVDENDREVAKYQQLWTALFPEEILHLPRLSVPDGSKIEATVLLNQLGIHDRNFFVCAPSGTQNVAIKKWPADRFAQVCAWVHHQYGFQPLLIGHENERVEIEAVGMILEGMGIAFSSWLGRDGEISLLSALVEKSRLFLGNDTGAMHIAAAVGTPVVGIFGGGTFPRFLPVGLRCLGVAKKIHCFGCYWDCAFTCPPCLTAVCSEDVQTAISHVLQENNDEKNLYIADTLRKEMSETVTIATSIAPRNLELQIQAIDSWVKLGFSVISVNSRTEICLLAPKFPDVSFIEITRNALLVAGKPYVYFDDILKALSGCGSAICGIVNSDIYLTDRFDLLDIVKFGAVKSFIFGSRTDVSSLDDVHGKQFILGFDYFFFDRELIALYPKSNFCLGAPWWDYWAPLIPMLKENVVVKRFMESDVALHINHDVQWSQSSYDSFGHNLGNYLLELGVTNATNNLALGLIRANINNTGKLSHIIHYFLESNSVDFFYDNALNTDEHRISIQLYHDMKQRMIDYRYDSLINNKLEVCEADRTERLKVIHALDLKLQECDADRAERLAIIHKLEARLRESEADRAERLHIIHKLEAQLHESEIDRAARLDVITDLGSQLVKLKTSFFQKFLKKMRLIR